LVDRPSVHRKLFKYGKRSAAAVLGDNADHQYKSSEISNENSLELNQLDDTVLKYLINRAKTNKKLAANIRIIDLDSDYSESSSNESDSNSKESNDRK
jgi:hypothetical protein